MANVSKNKREPKPPFGANNYSDVAATKQRYKRVDYIPIDYISANIIGLPKHVLEQKIKNLGLHSYEVLKAGQLIVKISEHKSLQIRIGNYSSGGYFMNFQGSLHKYWNNGRQNYNNFNECNFKMALQLLNKELGLTPANLYIKALEVGVNIEPPLSPRKIINHCFIHRRKDFEQQISNDKGKYHQVKHNKYILKIYDKGLQYKLKNEILRIEIKYTNWSEYRSNGINTLEDFISIDKTPFVEDLISKWNEVVFFDPTFNSYSTQHQYNNRLYWQQLQSKSRNTYSKHVKKLRTLGYKNAQDIQGKIATLINNCIINGEGVTNTTLHKKCLITNIDISRQRKDSRLLSHTGLKYMYETDPQQFNKLSRKLLPFRWKHSISAIIIREIAHTIRNKYYYKIRLKKTKGVTNSTLYYS